MERRPKNTSRNTQICSRFRYISERPKLKVEINQSTVSQRKLEVIENIKVALRSPDVWQESEGEEEPRHKTTNVGKVVDPRKQAKGE